MARVRPLIDRTDVFEDREVAEQYRHRPPYPSTIFAALERLLVAPHTVLDAGAGTGALARTMVKFAARVDALDPSETMVAVGRGLPRGRSRRLRWIVGRAEDAALSPPYGLITCGASLHWMDHEAVLARFQAVLAGQAVVAVVDTENVHGAYREEVWALTERYGGAHHHAGWQELVEWLDASAHFEMLGVERTPAVAFRQSVDDYIAYLHTTSALARTRLGRRAEAFDADLRAVFARYDLDELTYGVRGLLAWGRPR
jgi:SAM-dependent methyltransferase